jgi:hypothetical protein
LYHPGLENLGKEGRIPQFDSAEFHDMKLEQIKRDWSLVNELIEKSKCYWAYVTSTNQFGVTHDTVCVCYEEDIIFCCPDFLDNDGDSETESLIQEIDKYFSYRMSPRKDFAFLYNSPTFKITKTNFESVIKKEFNL